jgi:hypothetical protein
MMYRLGEDGQTLYFTNKDQAENYSYNISDKAVLRVNDVINELLCTSDVPINLPLALTEFASRVWDAHLI